jgi:hypothetical protein
VSERRARHLRRQAKALGLPKRSILLREVVRGRAAYLRLLQEKLEARERKRAAKRKNRPRSARAIAPSQTFHRRSRSSSRRVRGWRARRPEQRRQPLLGAIRNLADAIAAGRAHAQRTRKKAT